MNVAPFFFRAGGAPLTPYHEAVSALPPDRFVEVAGRQVHVDETGTGEPILLLHGFAASTFSFHKLIPLLESRFRVVAVDLYGFGFTERPDSLEPYTLEGQVGMIEAVMNRLGVKECVVAGHSYGAALAMLLTTRQPQRIRRLVLISPAAEFQKAPWYLRAAPGRMLAYGMVRLLLSNPARFRRVLGNAYHRKEVLTPAVSEAYRKRLLIEGLGDSFRGFGSALAKADDFRIDFEVVRAPSLVIAGHHDAIIGAESCRRVAEELPQANLVTLEHSGHSAPEEEPDALAQAIVKHAHR